MASTVAFGVPETASVRAKRLPVGQSLPPDASQSCREEQIAPIRRYLPVMLSGGIITVHFGLSARLRDGASRPSCPEFSYKNRMTDTLTGQRPKMQVSGKPC